MATTTAGTPPRPSASTGRHSQQTSQKRAVCSPCRPLHSSNSNVGHSATASPKKKKRKSAEATRCVCGKKECKQLMGRLESLMKKLGELPKDESLDHVYKHVPLYYCVPAEPKNNPNRKTKLKPSELVKRRDQQTRHDQIVAQFSDNAKERINLHNKPGAKDEDRYSSKTNPKFACIHLHPELLQHFNEQQLNQLPPTIPRALGQKLDKEGTCSFRASDELPSSQSRDYIPLPNYPFLRQMHTLRSWKLGWKCT